jgi:hypothetical protein
VGVTVGREEGLLEGTREGIELGCKGILVGDRVGIIVGYEG